MSSKERKRSRLINYNNSKKINTKKNAAQPPPPKTSNQLTITNLPKNITENDLLKLLSSCASVQQVTISKVTNRATVKLASRRDALEVKTKFDGTQPQGWSEKLVIQFDSKASSSTSAAAVSDNKITKPSNTSSRYNLDRDFIEKYVKMLGFNKTFFNRAVVQIRSNKGVKEEVNPDPTIAAATRALSHNQQVNYANSHCNRAGLLDASALFDEDEKKFILESVTLEKNLLAKQENSDGQTEEMVAL